MTSEISAAEIGKGLCGRRTQNGWMACCPAHRDRNPSLHISERDGRVLVKCFAGCEQRDVIAALQDRGLWPDGERREHPDNWGVIVQTYDYVDEEGNLLYQVCRFQPKSFRPRRPDGAGGWRWGYGNLRRVLYRLPEVLAAPIVFIVEGEKDVETLREWGFVATTNSGGANGWRPEFNHVFHGREVVIIPDMDPPGVKRACNIARGLLDIAARIRMLSPDDLRGTKDISEWFEQGHSECELIAMLEGCDAV